MNEQNNNETNLNNNINQIPNSNINNQAIEENQNQWKILTDEQYKELYDKYDENEPWYNRI